MPKKTAQIVKFLLSITGIIVLILSVWYGFTLLDAKTELYALMNILSMLGISIAFYIIWSLLYWHVLYRLNYRFKLSVLLTPIVLVVSAFIGKYIWIMQNTPLYINSTSNFYFDSSAYIFLFMICVWVTIGGIILICSIILTLFFIVATVFGGLVSLWEFFGKDN